MRTHERQENATKHYCVCLPQEAMTAERQQVNMHLPVSVTVVVRRKATFIPPRGGGNWVSNHVAAADIVNVMG